MRAVPVALALALACGGLSAAKAHAVPVASFTYEPESPLTHERVTFESTATAGDAEIVTREWDLNGDGEYEEASGSTATWTYRRPGPIRAALRVVDSAGNEDISSRRLMIGNRAPTASFVLVPAQPSPGEPVSFLSTSFDPDGFITSYAWDLDGDGVYDDRQSSQASATFPAGGISRIGLRVTDDSGSVGTSLAIIAIGDPGGSAISTPIQGDQPPPAGAAGVSLVRLLTPFPVVRVSGIVRKRGIRLRLLSVSAPLGATVKVRCRGRGCPFRRQIRAVRARARSAAAAQPVTGTVKIRRFRRRLLRVGAIVKVLVTRPDAIGKYTRLRIREGKVPARTDRCLPPGGGGASFPCPAA